MSFVSFLSKKFFSFCRFLKKRLAFPEKPFFPYPNSGKAEIPSCAAIFRGGKKIFGFVVFNLPPELYVIPFFAFVDLKQKRKA